MQTLYAYHVSEDKSTMAVEKALLKSIEEVDEMYIWMLNLLDEVTEHVVIDSEDRGKKWLPSDNDRRLQSTKINQNTFIESLRQNKEYVEKVKKYKVAWNFDPELIRSIYAKLIASDVYLEYLDDEDFSIANQKNIIKYIFKKLILKNTEIEQVFEEKFLSWPIDKEVLQAMMAKTLKNFSSEVPSKNKLAILTPNWIEDKDFVIDLLHKSIKYHREYSDLIGEKTKNWEADRIAIMDNLLMVMAIAELLNFPTIPTKVTMNEYIELSKDYSTLKSSNFINGILDKILVDLKASGRLKKEGRGLIE